MSSIQAVLFERDKWDTTRARQWLKKNGYKPIKRCHVTSQYLRYRLRQPSSKYRYVTKSLGKGVKIIVIVN
jgi:hypothetical protein